MASLLTSREVAGEGVDHAQNTPDPCAPPASRAPAVTADRSGSPETIVAPPLGPLQWATYAFERAQATRVATGEQLRAVLQGRNPKWAYDAGAAVADVDALLAAVRRGEGAGPVPVLGAAYRRHWEEEQQLLRVLTTLVTAHPAWPWIERVRGIGPTIAARLLSRLRVERAATPAAFWAYCGFGTVPARRYACDLCGTTLTRSAPAAGVHRAPTGDPCGGTLRPVPTTPGAPPVRAAPSRPRRGERAGYNPTARVVCYLLGVSILRRGGRYREYYGERRAVLDASRPEWTAMHRHRAALRAVQKLVLAHLWIVWREAVGLPVVPPFACAPVGDGGVGHIPTRTPWDMVDR